FHVTGVQTCALPISVFVASFAAVCAGSASDVGGVSVMLQRPSAVGCGAPVLKLISRYRPTDDLLEAGVMPCESRKFMIRSVSAHIGRASCRARLWIR